MYENVCFSQRIRILFFGMVKYMGYSSDTYLILYQIINIGF